MADAEQKRTLQQALRETWLSVLGGAEEQATRAAHRLLESMGLHPGEQGIARELAARMQKNRELIERRIEEGVKAAVARVRSPLVQEIAALRGRVEKLQRSVEEFRRRRGDGGNGAA